MNVRERAEEKAGAVEVMSVDGKTQFFDSSKHSVFYALEFNRTLHSVPACILSGKMIQGK